MPQRRQNVGMAAQRRVAQKYRLLGYEVEENPGADLLPEFMQSVRPDILARSKFDNVVVEVKERSALKGSNDLVGIAERISGHPEWRFELVVLRDEREQTSSSFVTTNYDGLLERIQIATSAHLPDMAYIYLASVLVAQAHDLARKHNINSKDKTDEGLFSDLSFRGVLPDILTEKCLSVISTRDNLAQTFDEAVKPSDRDLRHLLQLCRELEELT